MLNQPLTENIPIGTLGVIDLALPKITFDSGNTGPTLVFVAGQHGNETTPLFVLKKLIQKLSVSPLVKGRLVILPVVNPLGLIFESRREPLDGGNLNREAPGNSSKDLDKRTAAAIFSQCKDANLVVDLHTFSRQCPFVGVFVKGNAAAEPLAKTALRAINPDCIWQIDISRAEDTRYVGALDVALTLKGIPAISLEMERHLTIAESMIDRIVLSLVNLLIELGMYVGEINMPPPNPRIPVFLGNYLYFDGSGIFIPKKSVLTSVKQGEELGTVFDLRLLRESPVYAPVAGTLLTIRFRDVVRTGSKLGSIGEPIGVL